MAPKTIRVDEVEYVRADSIKEPDITGVVKIVILQRGWVMVGRFEDLGDNLCRLTGASSIRRWGTTMGLGQIAKGGPTKDTKLDKCHGVVEFHSLTVIATIACEESKWLSSL